MQDLRIKSLDFPHFMLTDAEEPNKNGLKSSKSRRAAVANVWLMC